MNSTNKKNRRKPVFLFVESLFLRQMASKKLQLLHCFWRFHYIPSAKNLHHSELFIGDTHYPNISFRRQDLFYSLNMHLGILPAGAMPQVNAELKHLEPIRYNILPEPSIDLPVLFGFCRKIEEYKYPHYPVSIETFKHVVG